MLGIGLGLNRGRLFGGALAALIKCGLISYTTPETDKVGKESRPAVRAEDTVGDGNTYGDTNIIPNADTTFTVWGRFKSLSTPNANQFIGSKAVNDRFYFGIQSSQWALGMGDVALTGGVADTLRHKFEIRGRKLFVDDVQIADGSAQVINPTKSLFLLGLNNNDLAQFFANFDLERSEIIKDGITYTLSNGEFRSDNKNQLIPSDQLDPIDVQWFVSPAEPTAVNTVVESPADIDGYTVSHELRKVATGEDLTFEGFIDDTNGNFVPNVNFRATDFIEVNSEHIYLTESSSPNTCWYDENKVFISRIVGTNLVATKPVNAKYIRSTQSITLDQNKFILAEGLYRDALLNDVFEYNSLIPNYPNSSTSVAFISDGQGGSIHPQGQYARSVKKNARVVDGVVDNGVDYENLVSSISGTLTTSSSGFEITLSSQKPDITIQGNNGLKASTEYLIVFNVSKNTLAHFFRTSNSGLWSTSTEVVGVGETGEVRTLVTTKASISGLSVLFTTNQSTIGELDGTIAIYEASQFTNPLTDPLPTSGELVIGNSFIKDQWYNGESIHDDNELLYDLTNDERKVVPIIGNEIKNNQLFISVDKQVVAFYEEPLTGDCLEKATQNLGFNETAIDSEDQLAVDQNDDLAYAYKEGVAE